MGKSAKKAATTKVEMDQKNSIEAYKDAVCMYQMTHQDADSVPASDFEWLLRPFEWYSHEPKFDDLYAAATACMTVLGATMIHLIRNEGEDKDSFEVSRIMNAMEVLGSYLDKATLSLPEGQESTNAVSLPLYSISDKVNETPKLMEVDASIIEKERFLAQKAKQDPLLAAALDRSPGERIEHLKNLFSSVTASKNFVYNIVRTHGESLIPEIEKLVPRLHPTDQDFFLHGLDAFPKSKKVLDFYDRFLKANKYPSLVENVEKYRGRVKKGVKTTGWET